MKKRLLVIDDEPAIVRLISRVAESCGFAVTATTDSESFLDELSVVSPDAIILDLSMPGTDGVELLRLLAASGCRARILIISGYDRRVLETSGKLAVARGLDIAGTIRKPARAAELMSAISALHIAQFNETR